MRRRWLLPGPGGVTSGESSVREEELPTMDCVVSQMESKC